MPHLLDAYNVLYAGQAMSGAMSNLTIRTLCQWILASPQRLKATLVLDGRPKPDEPSENEFPEITLLYSGAGIKADTVIAQLVERAAHRKKLTVVTNDRAVALHAHRHSANAISCEAFLSSLITAPSVRERLPAKKTTGTSTPGETAHWLKEFGLTPPPPTPPHAPPPTDDISNLDIDQLLGGRDPNT